MSTLVTLAEAKTHLKITDPDGSAVDTDLQFKLDAAEAAILNYIGSTAFWLAVIVEWDASTVPVYVKQAILLQVGEFWRGRGDDPESPPRDASLEAKDFRPEIVGLLRRTRDPVVR